MSMIRHYKTQKDKHNNIVDSSLTNIIELNIITIIDKCYKS